MTARFHSAMASRSLLDVASSSALWKQPVCKLKMGATSDCVIALERIPRGMRLHHPRALPAVADQGPAGGPPDASCDQEDDDGGNKEDDECRQISMSKLSHEFTCAHTMAAKCMAHPFTSQWRYTCWPDSSRSQFVDGFRGTSSRTSSRRRVG